VAIGTKSLEELTDRTASGSRLDTLIRLFCMNAPLGAGEIDAVLGSGLCAGLRAMGLVRADPSGERSRCASTRFAVSGSRAISLGRARPGRRTS
jgi:hypothetical protein